ncbi:PP2C family serine/threonine-protein phosphatase [Halalkalibacter lacteus]|uniref:PP2C family serine/threonine-protein phosphatase n=1 Tax=Halalkalibacter lacteus TaxID=3090663 RepID=UPI002FCA71D9
MVTFYNSEKIEVAAFEQAKQGNSCCGDAHSVIHADDYTVCAVADGLGSGEQALDAALAAIGEIQRYHGLTVGQMVEACNDALHNKRGAVLTVLKIDYKKQEISYCNYGNIGFVMYLPDGKTIQPIPSRGYLSGKKTNFKSSSFPYMKGSSFLLYSDGVKKRPAKDTLVQMTSPREASSYLFSNNELVSDDVTMLVGKLL